MLFHAFVTDETKSTNSSASAERISAANITSRRDVLLKDRCPDAIDVTAAVDPIVWSETTRTGICRA